MSRNDYAVVADGQVRRGTLGIAHMEQQRARLWAGQKALGEQIKQERAAIRTAHVCYICGCNGRVKADDTLLCEGRCVYIGRLSARLVEAGVPPMESDEVASDIYWYMTHYQPVSHRPSPALHVLSTGGI